ncbi:MAG: hypothetical protein A2505_08625 [Deltaproteobacteria bacterium RIFOXYD12_FULL_55_16]|nr:MAG: hypothetical protein A2505_08625 [Deltaproteobacteria bacterium RIFOXYD12_FULL_55_16]
MKTTWPDRALTCLLLLLLAAGLTGCALPGQTTGPGQANLAPPEISDPSQAPNSPQRERSEEAASSPRIAVLPFVNLSAAPAPLKEIRQKLLELLRDQGMNLLEEKELLALMKRHRMRSTAGLTTELGEAFLKEAGVTGVLITQLTQYQTYFPPKFALTSRLVTTGEKPMVGWADSLIMTGDAQRGLLDLKLIRDFNQLYGPGLARLATSLSRSFEEQANGNERKFLNPRSFYRAPALAQQDRPLTVAILPFINQSQNRFASDLIALDFLRHLSAENKFQVLDPGLLEEQLLGYRIIMPYGTSLDTADMLFNFLDVDLLLAGKILEYEEASGVNAVPRVHFTAQIIQRQNHELVWSSISSNYGDEGVYFFDFGLIKTARELASRMVRSTVRQMAQP